MLPSFLLSLREGIEAALIIGIVIGTLQKINRTDLVKTVWIGAACAAAVSLLAAIVLNKVGTSLEGEAEEIFEGFTMLVAAGVLTWMIFWMSRQARQLRSELESGVRRAVSLAGYGAIFLLAFTAVVREGIELALFLTAAAMTSSATGGDDRCAARSGNRYLVGLVSFYQHRPSGSTAFLPGDRRIAGIVCGWAGRPRGARIQ